MRNRRFSKKNLFTSKTVANWPKQKIAQARYLDFVKPHLRILRIMANVISRGKKALVDDMVQEATIKIIAASGGYNPKKGSKKTFAIAVARNRMLDIAKAESGYKNRFHQISSDYIERLINCIDKNADPWREISKIQRTQIVEGTYALLSRSKLGPRVIETFVYFVGLEDGKIKTYGQVAKHFGILIGTVKSRIYSVRNELHRLIGVKKLRYGKMEK